MRVESIRTLSGPNVYSHRPVLLMRLDLEELYERESCEVPGFVERLLAAVPGLSEHHCSKGYAGGFVERLNEGTYFGHTVEHVALELAGLAGCSATHGKTRYSGEGRVYNVVIEFCAEQATRYLLERAVALVGAVIRGEEFPINQIIEEANEIAAVTELGPSTRSIVDAAAARGIPWARENEASLVRLGYGRHLRLIQAAMTDGTSAIGVEVAGDKDLTKARLAKASIPVPAGEVVRTEEGAVAALGRLGGAVVVKPLDGRQGKGVSLNLSTPEEVGAAFRIAREFSREVLVEEMFEGRNYRVLVVGYRVAAASERIPCHVTGDGVHTSDVGVMTNVGADHIGQDGIESAEDILWIKSLVAERVREGGTLILNADDELLATLPERPAVKRVPKRYVYFSLRDDNPVLLESVANGGTGYFRRGGKIFEVEGGEEHFVVEAAAIPATVGGTADFQIANAMAAIAAARALGLSREEVGASIASFRSDAENPGRANLYRVRAGYVMVDYGHNPEAFLAVCQMAAKWEGRRVTGIIGVPGDRDDSVIERAGRVAARGFHRVIIREDRDLRGRQPGEVARLLCEAVGDEWPGTECRIVLDEVEALREELQSLADGQVVVIFYDRLEPVTQLLEEYGARPTSTLEPTGRPAQAAG